MFNTVLDIIKGVIKREAARLIAYSSAAATGLALLLADKLGIQLSEAFLAAVGIFAVAVVTEAIRALVYSEDSVQKIADKAAEGTPPADLEEIKSEIEE